MATPVRASQSIRPVGAALSCLVVFATSCAATGNAGVGDRGVPRPTTQETTPVPAPPPPGSSVSVETTPADEASSYAASTLSQELEGDPHFASVESVQENHIIVHWYGPVDSKLQDLMSRFPEIRISVQQSPCPPGQLRDRGAELLESDPAVKIVAVSPDGSHLQITLDEALKTTADAASLEGKYSAAVGCTVDLEFGGVVPAQG